MAVRRAEVAHTSPRPTNRANAEQRGSMENDVKPGHTSAAQAGVSEQNPIIKRIRAKRIVEEISGALLARKAGIERTRLSFLECGHIRPTEHETKRLGVALDQLIAAKRQVQELAASVGWPA